MGYPVTLIPGDGIGAESNAMRRVVDATGVSIDWEIQSGRAVIDKYGTPLPEHVLSQSAAIASASRSCDHTHGTGFAASTSRCARRWIYTLTCVRAHRAEWPLATRTSIS